MTPPPDGIYHPDSTKELRERIAGLTPDKRALLERHLAQASRVRSQNGHIDSERRSAASYAQQQMWLLDQLQDEPGLYTITRAYSVKGALDIDVLRACIDSVVSRHEPFRTTFAMSEGGLEQIIHDYKSAPFDTIDLTREADYPTVADRISVAKNIVQREADRSFDLSVDAMHRTVVVRVDEHAYIVLFVQHHIASDGWSFELFKSEVDEVYSASMSCRRPDLPDLPIRYSDFAAKQRTDLDKEGIHEHLQYWGDWLAGLPARTLPCDHPHSRQSRFRGAERTCRVQPHVLEAMIALARQQRTTLFVVLLAAYELLLHRFYSLNDVVVGTPAACRSIPGVEHLIGYFVNTIVLRTDLSGDPDFIEIVDRVRKTTAGALVHQELPFEKLVESLQPARTGVTTPFFQTAFALNTESEVPFRSITDLRVEPFPIHRTAAKFDLFADLTLCEDGLECTFIFDTDRYDGSTIERLLLEFETLLGEIASADDRRAGKSRPGDTDHRAGELRPDVGDRRGIEFKPGDAREPDPILETANRTRTDYPRESTVHELFREKAALHPDAVAVEDGARRLTYGELDRWSDRVASQLLAGRLKPGSYVGILADRSVEFIVASLAILKTGGVYVPLDPENPAERLEYLIEDAGLSVVLTRGAVTLPGVDGVSYVRIEEDIPTSARVLPLVAGGAGSPAYVMYTSGSTGYPKGVVVPHRAIIRLVRHTNYISLTARDAVAHASNVTFDASTFEIWGALLNGARLTIFHPHDLLEPGRLSAMLRERSVTVLFLTTSLFNAIAYAFPGAFAGIRNVLFGGETADPDAVRAVLSAGPPDRLINAYGPTESTTFATTHLIEILGEDATSLPIGLPISNTRVYVLDEAQHPVGRTVAGELYIGGDGVALGYLGDPAQTSERFLADPFAPEPGQMMYRTGDRVMWTEDGVLEFLGRMDRLVKLRGYRIELDEIESNLSRHPHVRRVAVEVIRHDRREELVAFILSVDDIDPAELRRFAASSLPAYMIPTSIHVLDEWPLTSSGKLDRKRLPSLRGSSPGTGGDELPAGASEAELLKIWRRVLGCNDLTATDNFFEAGGHSLLAIRLFHEIEQVFGKRLRVASLFDAPTVRGLARLLHLDRLQDSHSSLITLRRTGTRPPLIFVHGISANPMHYRSLYELLDADQPVFGLQGEGLDGGPISDASVEAMASRYADDITAALPDGPYLLAGFCYGGLLAYEIARQLERRGKTVSLLALLDAINPNAIGHSSGMMEIASGMIGDVIRLAGRHSQNASTPADVLSKVSRYAAFRMRHVVRNTRLLICRILLSAGRPTPHQWRAEYVQNVYQRLIASYRPAPYAGRTVLFRSNDSDGSPRHLGWEGWITDPTVYDIGGDHFMMRSDVRFDLARKLEHAIAESHLVDAQSNRLSRSNAI